MNKSIDNINIIKDLRINIWKCQEFFVIYIMVYIYKIVSPNNSIYIGQTRNLKERIRKYKTLQCKGQRKLYSSIYKYGFDSHKFTILNSFDYIDKEELNRLEYEIINHYSSLGFNMLNLRFSNEVYSSESLKLMSKKSKCKKITQYSKEGLFIKHWDSLISASNALSIHYQGITCCMKGITRTCGGFIWREYSSDLKIEVNLSRKRIINRKKRICIKYAKPIFQYSLSGDLVKKWNNSKEASDGLNISYSNIRMCASNKTKSAGGFIWIDEKN